MRPKAVPVGALARESLRVHAEVHEVAIDVERCFVGGLVDEPGSVLEDLCLGDSRRKSKERDHVHVVR